MSKDEILKVSEKLFFAKTYSDVKLDVIADKLWIQKPSLYHYFKDKKDLFVQTMSYSQWLYFNQLKEVLKKKDIKYFLKWYISYPSNEKNLFSISFQKDIFDDNLTRKMISDGKQQVYIYIKDFLKDLNFDNIQVYLMINLLDKLAMDNCIQWYCLKFDLDTLVEKIYKMFCR